MHSKKKILIAIIILLNMFYIPITFASTDEAGVFSSSDLVGSYGVPTANLASSGLQSLNYDVTDFNSSVSNISTIVNYVSGMGNNYALYVKGHGNTSAFGLYQDGTGGVMTPYNGTIAGYWHFVFMDACSCAATDVFADAFNILGYSNRAFMGWYTDVNTATVYQWFQYFWADAGSDTLRNVALDACDYFTVPGSTPIRMYGDKYWYGYAW